MNDQKLKEAMKVIHLSPVGIASWPKLNEPDTKFNPDGTYEVNLLVPEGDLDKIGSAVETVQQGSMKNNFFKEDLDSEGNPTGKYLVKFKMKAIVRPRNSKAFTQKPILVDANGDRMFDKIGGGSRIEVKYTVAPYDAFGGGVSLRLKAVRVLDLVQPGGDVGEWGETEGTYQASGEPEVPEGSDGELTKEQFEAACDAHNF